MSETVCTVKHTKYQPSYNDWLCPVCKSNNELFIVESSPEDTHPDCELLHDDDEVKCSRCGLYGLGKQIAAKMVKVNDLVKCSCCNGAGYVKRKE